MITFPFLFSLFLLHYQLSPLLQIGLQIRDAFVLYIHQHRCRAILRLHSAEGYIVHLQAIHVAGKETIGWCLLGKLCLWIILALLTILTLGKLSSASATELKLDIAQGDVAERLIRHTRNDDASQGIHIVCHHMLEIMMSRPVDTVVRSLGPRLRQPVVI